MNTATCCNGPHFLTYDGHASANVTCEQGFKCKKAFCTGEESAGVFKIVIFAPFPVSFAYLTDDEEYDSDGCTKQRSRHQELESEYQTLK